MRRITTFVLPSSRRLNVVGLLLVLVCACVGTVHAVTSPMPYRPGYGLGSWVPPQVIEGMKKEAYARSGILLADQMVNDATSLARELKLAQSPVKNPLNNQQEIKVPLNDKDYKSGMDRINDVRAKAWNMKISQYENLFAQMEAQVNELTEASKGDGKGTVKAFTTFASGAESPTIWDTSKIDYVDRAFDSITVSSAFMDIEAIQQFTRDTSSSSSFEGSTEDSFQSMFVTASFSASVASASAKRLPEVYSVKSVETTLILSSFATHRMVKQFTTLNVDVDKLREAWNFYKKEDPIPHPVYEQAKFVQAFLQGIAQPENTEERISFVTEVFQGSAMVGFVHFIKVESTKSSTSETSSSESFKTKEKVDMNLWLSSMTGSTSFSKDAAEKIASMASQSGLDIQFDLVCLGYVPNIKSQVIETAIASFKSIDVNSQTTNRQGAAGQTEQQDNTNSVIGGTLGALNKMVSENPVLGVQTFMDAFDDYAQAAHSRPNEIGAPVGLNVREYSKMDIIGMLADHYLGPNAKSRAGGPTGANDTGSSSASSGGAAPAAGGGADAGGGASQ